MDVGWLVRAAWMLAWLAPDLVGAWRRSHQV
jgi:hypothetical protein